MVSPLLSGSRSDRESDGVFSVPRKTWLRVHESCTVCKMWPSKKDDAAGGPSRYRVLVESVPAAVYIDVADDLFAAGGRVSYISPQIETILGYQPESFMSDPELSVVVTRNNLDFADGRQTAGLAHLTAGACKFAVAG